MKAAIHFAFATILIVLLLCAPVGACMGTGAPSHPCCPPKPVPLPQDCARPGCVYLDTHQAPEVASIEVANTPVAALPATFGLVTRSVATQTITATLAPPLARTRVVLFQQFLI